MWGRMVELRTEAETRLPVEGGIGLQIHRGGKGKDHDGKFMRHKNFRATGLEPR